jgi:phosphatidylinositol-3,4,5-trisphosphate 3-phosphatase/dual-specificity protein phosphatase PTEN
VDLELVSATQKGVLTPRCPLYENAYSAESMSGRVSRYPFPDHHAPPLSLLPLAVREMNAWLDGDPERVAIIHCKAGKVRNSKKGLADV